MLKKLISMVLSICLVLSVNALAVETATDENIPSASREMPQGGEGRRRTPPSMPNGEFDPSQMPQRGEFDPSKMPQRGEFDPSKMPERGEFDPSKIPQENNNGTKPQGNAPADRTAPADNGAQAPSPQTNINPDNEAGDTVGEVPADGEGQPQFGGRFPGGMGGFNGGMQEGAQPVQSSQQTGFAGFVKTYSTPITSVILLGLAYVFLFLYKRKHY